MKQDWPRVQLGNVVSQVQRDEAPTSGKNYRQIGVRLWGQGAYERESIDGSQTQYTKLFEAREGDIIVNKIWARNGSVAVVSESLNGTWGSTEFPLFEPDRTRLNPRWMHWITKAPWFWNACDEHAKGTSGKNRIKPDQFLGIEIPLPTLEMQKNIVARIDAVQQQMSSAEKLRISANADLYALCRALVINDPSSKRVEVAELVQQRSLDVNVKFDVSYQFAGVYSFGRGVFKGGIKTGAEFAYPKLSLISTGDFIYPKLMAWEGALGVVPKDCDGCVVSPEFPVFEIDNTKVLPDVFDVYFRDPNTWGSLQGGSIGTNARRRRLNPTDFLKLKIPVPSMATQQKLAAIRSHQNRIDSFNTKVESNALLSSLLNMYMSQE
jgi:type I restriction enzyme, S subunit